MNRMSIRILGTHVLAAMTGVHAQEELPLKHDLAAGSPPDCRPGEAASEPDPEERMQATELASISGQALIPGDFDRLSGPSIAGRDDRVELNLLSVRFQ